jgi:hypothetical protein
MAHRVIIVSLAAIVASCGTALAQQPPQGTSCDELLPAKKQVGGLSIGPEECRIVSRETVVNIKGQKFQRLELKISGTVEGWATKQGPRSSYFNDGPDFVFAQSGNNSPRFNGIGRYSGSTGHGISLFLPDNAADWNGKLFVTAHGAGSYGGIGQLIERDPKADFHPLANKNRYVGLMLDRGYAVAHTLRSADIAGGDVEVTLEDGAVQKNNVSTHAGFLTGFARIAGNAVRKQYGRSAERTYFYGFSAGGFLGRLVHYMPGANRADDGRPLFDAFLIGDAGSGLWLPMLKVDGKDTLFVGEDRARFMPQIDITHQLYAGEDNENLSRKRENAAILRQKGLDDKHRMYEIRGVSHIDAGQVSRPELVAQSLDLGGLNEAFLDLLDRWVVNGEAPPPTKSDLVALGDADRDGVNENPAIALPEVACPLGVYYAMPAVHGTSRRSYQETGFAPFDGADLEPLDGRGQAVDMNGNGARDKRETLVQAWTRLGLLKTGEKLTVSTYSACVANAAAKLVEQRLLPPRVLTHYVSRATAGGVGE